MNPIDLLSTDWPSLHYMILLQMERENQVDEPVIVLIIHTIHMKTEKERKRRFTPKESRLAASPLILIISDLGTIQKHLLLSSTTTAARHTPT